jgi:hypothetical protein
MADISSTTKRSCENENENESESVAKAIQRPVKRPRSVLQPNELLLSHTDILLITTTTIPSPFLPALRNNSLPFIKTLSASAPSSSERLALHAGRKGKKKSYAYALSSPLSLRCRIIYCNTPPSSLLREWIVDVTISRLARQSLRDTIVEYSSGFVQELALRTLEQVPTIRAKDFNAKLSLYIEADKDE